MSKPSLNETIETYITLLKGYNDTTNIYAKTAYDNLPFHINDALLLADIIQNTPITIFDIGSGSGFPAIIIALKNTANRVYAIESKRRKTKFLEQVKQTLGIPNLQIITQNAFELFHDKKRPKPDIVTAKAFGSLEKLEKIFKTWRHHPKTLYIPISARQKETYTSSEKQVQVLAHAPHFFLQKQYNA